MLAGVAAMGLAAGAAAAQEGPTFPRSLEREPLLAWLQRETDIMPDRVVAVTPQAVTAVVSTFPAGGGQGPRVVIRAEALSGETYARTGALSWHVSLSADCPGHRVRMGDTTGYPGRNLLGERRILRPAEPDWRTPEPGTALDNAWRAACDSTFVGPFHAAGVKLVQADTTPAPKPVAAAPARVAPTAVSDPPPPAAPVPPAPPARRIAAAPAAALASSGRASVQIGSFADKAGAAAALARLGDGRAHGLEPAVVAGRTWYRAVVSGFASSDEAVLYCASRRAAGGVCFVRR
jgi:hypothetical protein